MRLPSFPIVLALFACTSEIQTTRTGNVLDYVLPPPGTNRLVYESTQPDSTTKRTYIYNSRHARTTGEGELEILSLTADGEELQSIALNKLKTRSDRMTLFETIITDQHVNQKHYRLPSPIDLVRLPAPNGKPTETWDCDGVVPADERHTCRAAFETIIWEGKTCPALVVTQEVVAPSAQLTIIHRYAKDVGLVSEEAHLAGSDESTVFVLTEMSYDPSVPEDD